MHAFADALVLETEGNPLFIGEVLRNLVEAGHLVQREGLWSSAIPLGNLEIPEGVKNVIGQRIDRLGDAADVVLQTAAVAGDVFDFDVVAVPPPPTTTPCCASSTPR